MRIRILVVAVAVGAGCGQARAVSFDCKLAKTPIEKTICSSPELGRLDDAMAAKYKQVLAEVPADVQADLKQFQRAWLRGLPVVCKANTQLTLADCLTGEYKGQIKALGERVQQRAGVTFVERSIELTAKDDADDPWKDDKELAQTPGYGTLDASWPQALSSDPVWTAWNAAVLAETQRMADSGDDKAPHGWTKSMAQDMDATVTATLAGVSAQLVSVDISNGYMGHGAAHPGESYETFHWLLQEKRRLKTGDVFASPGWEAVMTARCKAALKQQVGDDYQSYAGASAAEFAKTLHSVVADPANWDIDAKGVTINFPEYSVTPRSEPVDPVTVPWGALQSYLNQGFVVPR